MEGWAKLYVCEEVWLCKIDSFIFNGHAVKLYLLCPDLLDSQRDYSLPQ